MIKKFNENIDEVESPCIGVCKINKNGICSGCKRSIDEIKYWWDMSNEQKEKVVKRLKKNKDIQSGSYYGDFPF